MIIRILKRDFMYKGLGFNGIAHFEKCKQLCEHQHLLLLKETSGGQISNPYLNVVHFLNT
jgi:hypothetical protein